MEPKNTGIVRRIDDLGRVVIPKEIRRTMGIKEADPLELFIIDDMIAFKKYDASYPVISTVEKLCEMISEPDMLTDFDEADAIAIKALAKILKKNFKQLAANEEKIARG